MNPVLMWGLTQIIKIAVRSLTKSKKHPYLKDATLKVQDEIDTIRNRKYAEKHPPQPPNGTYVCGTLILVLTAVCAVLVGCLQVWRLADLWPVSGVPGLSSKQGTTTTTGRTTDQIPPVPTTTRPPRIVTTDGNYQTIPLSFDGTNTVNVPAFMFELWATRDQPPPVGARYPKSAQWTLRDRGAGLIITNGHQDGGWFYVRVNAANLGAVELAVTDDKVYRYAPVNPMKNQYPIGPTVQ